MDVGAISTDLDKADLGTEILGAETFEKLRLASGTYADGDREQRPEGQDRDLGAVARVGRARGRPLTTPAAPVGMMGGHRATALAMVTTAAALLQQTEGAVTDGYDDCDSEVCLAQP